MSTDAARVGVCGESGTRARLRDVLAGVNNRNDNPRVYFVLSWSAHISIRTLRSRTAWRDTKGEDLRSKSSHIFMASILYLRDEMLGIAFRVLVLVWQSLRIIAS